MIDEMSAAAKADIGIYIEFLFCRQISVLPPAIVTVTPVM